MCHRFGAAAARGRAALRLASALLPDTFNRTRAFAELDETLESRDDQLKS